MPSQDDILVSERPAALTRQMFETSFEGALSEVILDASRWIRTARENKVGYVCELFVNNDNTIEVRIKPT